MLQFPFFSYGEDAVTSTRYPIVPELFYFFTSGQEGVEEELIDIAVWLSPYAPFVVIEGASAVVSDTASFFMMPPFFCATTS